MTPSLTLADLWKVASLAMQMSNMFPDSSNMRERAEICLDAYFARCEAEQRRQETEK